jgi:hypothetical protein
LYGTAVVGTVYGLGELAGIEHDFGDLTLRFEEGLGVNPATTFVATTLVSHAHLTALYKGALRLGLHSMTAWTADERMWPRDPDGRMNVLGADMRFEGNGYGDLFIGGSYVKLDHVEHMASAIQVVHVAGGQAMLDNFLGPDTSPETGNDHGTGSLRNLLVQYDFSFGALRRHPQPFYGDGPDLRISVFGMYTRVGSFDDRWNNVQRFKFGTEVFYAPFPWFAVATRFDHVIPNLNTDPNVTDPASPFRVKIKGQDFSVLAPRIVFRTGYTAHETVSLQYTHYFYGTMPNGNVGIPQFPKSDVVMINNIDALHRPWDSDIFSIRGTRWF